MVTIPVVDHGQRHRLTSFPVLEIGCYLGFSASIWSHAVGSDGTVTGLEFDPEYAKIAASKLAGLGIKNVEFKIGAAADSYVSPLSFLTQTHINFT
jgi:predicted O-methyltransferase YrrM